MAVSARRKNQKRKAGSIDIIQESPELKMLQHECLLQLEEKRKEIARINSLLNPEYILTSLTLTELSVKMPTNKDEMLSIDGVTENKFAQFGMEFIAVS